MHFCLQANVGLH